ncbi:hypothetical protein LWI29_004846 [Acer saccharum]|uniref:Uncharacterized protein n=1 Tax=Acer saccharum TaxID=4024 RepID=A0AA39VT14_ACESA|nr:hypothetical protein LWI29_004846 [Acer saccharum]
MIRIVDVGARRSDMLCWAIRTDTEDRAPSLDRVEELCCGPEISRELHLTGDGDWWDRCTEHKSREGRDRRNKKECDKKDGGKVIVMVSPSHSPSTLVYNAENCPMVSSSPSAHNVSVLDPNLLQPSSSLALFSSNFSKDSG